MPNVCEYGQKYNYRKALHVLDECLQSDFVQNFETFLGCHLGTEGDIINIILERFV